MAFKFSNVFSTWVVNSITQSFKSRDPASWQPNTTYQPGAQVVSGTRIYVATTAGSSGSIAPTHSFGTAIAGSVTWLYLSNVSSAAAVARNLYLGVGKSDPWADELNPDAATTTANSDREVKENLFALLALTSDNVRLGIERIEWETATVYPMYDAEDDSLPCYVINAAGDIYKCLDNNSGASSTIEPTGQTTSLIRLADNYTWKYMGTVSPQDSIRFSTTNFVPVSDKIVDDGSIQWQVQQAASPNGVSGFYAPINVGVFVANGYDDPKVEVEAVGGSGNAAVAGAIYDASGATSVYAIAQGISYDSGAYAVISEDGVPGSGAAIDVLVAGGEVSATVASSGSDYTDAVLIIDGDGVGAAGEVTVNAGAVTAVNITNAGSGYTWARAFIVPGIRGSIARATISPAQGHGKSIVSELGADALLISALISNGLAPYIQTMSYRQISLLSDVKPFGASQTNAPAYVGPIHPSFNQPSLNKYDLYTGNLLYLNNFAEVQHTESQEETFKAAIRF